ncbi:MAG: HisA/HisF-related TIM barrel protein [Methylococcales bacterium]
MQIIPVIDIKNGLVVHARQGNREFYQPLQSSLCDSTQPHAVINAFLALHAFPAVYIADLNRLSADGNNTQLIDSLLEQFPQVQFWIDQGVLYKHSDHLARNWNQVIGSESLTDSMLSAMASKPAGLILSLDFKQSLIGPNQLLETDKYWPEQVIIMALSKVGSNTGPDWERLEKIQQLTTRCRLVAAGGIRGLSDLHKLSKMGIHSALLASCLHNGQLSATDIQQLFDQK